MWYDAAASRVGFGFAGGILHGSRNLASVATEFVSRRVCHESCIQFANPGRTLTVQCKRGSNHRNRQRGDGRRPNRVGELIRREISPIIDDAFARYFRLEDGESPILVSVVDVKCSDDLRSARVSVSVFGTDEQKTEALRWLRGARKELRFELAQCVHLKHIPELSFRESEMAAAVRTMSLLDTLAKEREVKSSETVESGEESYQGAVADSVSLDDLGDFEFGGYIDEDDDAEDGVIIDVAGDDEDEEGVAFNADKELRR